MSGFFVILLGVVLLAGVVALAISWPTTSSSTSGGGAFTQETFSWILGNGQDIYLDFLGDWPFVKSGNQVSITYSFSIRNRTVADLALPVVLTLPGPGTNLTSEVTLTSIIPSGDTGMKVVQFSSSSVAFQFEPSGTYLTGANLVSSDWNAVFWVNYTLT